MHLISGLLPHGVFQRDERNRSRQTVQGRCTAGATIRVRVEAAGRALPRWGDRRLGRADDTGRFTVQIDGLPCGGPYTVQLRADKEMVRIEDVLVGDVWVLAGQSNMEGVGRLAQALPPHPLVRSYYMDDRWDIAKDPLHVLAQATARVHRLISPDCSRPLLKGVGPGLSFATTLAERHGMPQGLIACAHGGTSMQQWKPGKGDTCLFGAMVDRVKANGGRIAGVCWYQGESDAGAEAVPRYTRRMRSLITAMRRHFGPVPIALVQIGRVCRVVHDKADHHHWNAIREQQRLLPERLEQVTTVPSIDLPLDDLIHIGGDGQIELGRRLADAMDALRHGPRTAPPPISLAGVRTIRERRSGETVIEARFTGVVGSLTAAGRPLGFALDVDGRDTTSVYRCVCQGDRVIIRQGLGPLDLEEAGLCYGWGQDPCCTIVDAAGRSLPAFGPLPLGAGYPKTPFGSGVEASPVLPVATPVDKLPYPTRMPSFAPAPMVQWYNAITALRDNNDERLIYFRQRFRCRRRMRLDILLGYDGPIRVWFDHTVIFTDPVGTNPIVADAQVSTVSAGVGEHEILIALASNRGRALGIALRLGRRGKDLPLDLNCR